MNTADILKWIREVDPRDLPYNVIGIGWAPKISNGIETDEYGITFTVKEKKPLDELLPSEIIPKTLSLSGISVKTDVQVPVMHKHLYTDCHTISDTVSPVSANRAKSRPLRAGSESNVAWGAYVATLGTFVIDKTDGQIVALSNNHVYGDSQVIARYNTINGFETKNTLVLSGFQPTGYWRTTQQADYIGKCKRPVVVGNVNSDLDIDGWIINTSCDAAILSLSSYNLLDAQSLTPIGFEGNFSYEFATDAEIDSLLNPGSPNFAAPIFRSGRTCGPVGFPGTSDSCSLSVYAFDPALVGTYNGYVSWFFNSFFVRGTTVPGRGGDSGSAMYALFNQNTSLSAWKLIGLLFAGPNEAFPSYTIGGRITAIAQALNIAPWDGVTYPSLSAISNYTTTTTLNSATVVLSGRTFYQLGRLS